VDNNTLGGDRLDLSLRTSGDTAFVDLDRPAQELEAHPQASASDGPLGIDVTWEDVKSLLG
jgi:hypothetical protein